MTVPRTRIPRRLSANDVGTLWTMARYDLRARCALISNEGDWEVRVVVDDATLFAESCASAELAFGLAERWKALMAERGWRQIVPGTRYTEEPTNRAARQLDPDGLQHTS